jgi:hypothetical protein
MQKNYGENKKVKSKKNVCKSKSFFYFCSRKKPPAVTDGFRTEERISPDTHSPFRLVFEFNP